MCAIYHALSMSRRRTHATDLTHADLTLFDALAMFRVGRRHLGRDRFGGQFNTREDHGLEDAALDARLDAMIGRGWVTCEDGTIALTNVGGRLWEQERQPDWSRFVAGSMYEQDGQWIDEIRAWNPALPARVAETGYCWGLYDTPEFHPAPWDGEPLVYWRPVEPVFVLEAARSSGHVLLDGLERARTWWSGAWDLGVDPPPPVGVVVHPSPGPSNDRAFAVERPWGWLVGIAVGIGSFEAAERVVATVLAAEGDPDDVRTWIAALAVADRAVVGLSTGVVVAVTARGWCGASVGGSFAWGVLPDGITVNLTASQRPRPLLGTGAAVPVGFHAAARGRLFVGSTGLSHVPGIASEAGRWRLAEVGAAILRVARGYCDPPPDEIAMILVEGCPGR